MGFSSLLVSVRHDKQRVNGEDTLLLLNRKRGRRVSTFGQNKRKVVVRGRERVKKAN